MRKRPDDAYAAYYLAYAFVGAQDPQPAVTLLAKIIEVHPDFTDAHNSIKIDHLIVNNGSSGSEASGVQLNYVLNAEMFIVADAAGGGNGIALEQVQFSVLHGAGSAATGYALAVENGYSFSNALMSMDLEESHTCLRLLSVHAHSNSLHAPYFNCPVLVEATHQGSNAVTGTDGTTGSAVVTPVTWLD